MAKKLAQKELLTGREILRGVYTLLELTTGITTKRINFPNSAWAIISRHWDGNEGHIVHKSALTTRIGENNYVISLGFADNNYLTEPYDTSLMATVINKSDLPPGDLSILIEEEGEWFKSALISSLEDGSLIWHLKSREDLPTLFGKSMRKRIKNIKPQKKPKYEPGITSFQGRLIAKEPAKYNSTIAVPLITQAIIETLKEFKPQQPYS